MRTDIGKFSPSTMDEMCKRMGERARRAFNFFRIDGVLLIGPDGDRSTVQPWMEIVFADTATIEINSNKVECLNIKWTNGDTISTFAPFWFKG